MVLAAVKVEQTARVQSVAVVAVQEIPHLFLMELLGKVLLVVQHGVETVLPLVAVEVVQAQ